MVALNVACSKEDDNPRTPDNINGIWQNEGNVYKKFQSDYYLRTLTVEYQDGQSIGTWGESEVYFYEPGYNLVIYVTTSHEADVYQIVKMDSNSFTWCPVDKIDDKGDESIGEIIGDIINKAQEGYELNPELYQKFIKISDLKFEEMLESLDIIIDPWMDDDEDEDED
ncbi:MAG: hypothetical protein J1E16_01200 [Muribaculaceae bacterium]|nr:hypothetical protein [Muribaculaceae bacterium]